MFKFAMLVVLWAPPQSDSGTASVADASKDLAKRVVANIKQQRDAGTLSGLQLDVSVRSKTVTVTGQVASSEEARVIMNAICDADGAEGIQLNLGFNRAPTVPHPNPSWPYPNYDPALWRKELNWDDGWWQLDFDGHTQTATRLIDQSNQ